MFLRIIAVLTVISVAFTDDALAQSTLIPVDDRRDLLHESTRNELLISTGRGVVERYDIESGQLLAPLSAGEDIPQDEFHFSLWGMDTLPDGSSVLVTGAWQQGSPPSAQFGFVRRIDLETGQIEDYPWERSFREGGGWDVAVSSNGKALFTTVFLGSGWTPLREIELATSTVRIRKDSPAYGNIPTGNGVRGRTTVSRASDQSTFFFRQYDTSNGPVCMYDSTSDSFSDPCLETQFHDGLIRLFLHSNSAVSRDGSLLALEMGNVDDPVRIFNRDLEFQLDLNSVRGGLAFDPIRDILYTADDVNDIIIAWDTDTWNGLFALPTDEDIPESGVYDNGVMTVSQDGQHLFLSTPTGVRMYELPFSSCTADIAGDDNEVNVFDLLELLANWGADGPGADLDEPNDIVNVFDLLALLSAWGACP